MDDVFSDALRQVLAGRCTPAVVRQVERGESSAALWEALEASGFGDALLTEAQGGAGLSLQDAFPLFELCGSHALPLPLAETMVARALLAAAGITPPPGSITLAAADLNDDVVHCATVPYGRVADFVLVSVTPAMAESQGVRGLVLLPTSTARHSPAVFPLDSGLAWPAAAIAEAPRLPAADLRTICACILAVQLSGALSSVFSRTLQYANERVQFGKAIGKFQAIQHQLSVMAEHVFASRMAAQIGCRGTLSSLSRDGVAVAKARTGEAVVDVAALAHSIHGAIGFTEEYDLQLYTRRLHMWRQAAGSESYWHDVLGARLLAREDRTIELIRAITDIHDSPTGDFE